MSEDLENVFDKLGDMSKQDLKELKTKLNVLTSGDEMELEHSSLIYNALTQALQKRSLSCPPYALFKKNSLFGKFCEQLEMISPFTEVMANTVTKTQMFGSFVYFTEMVMEDIDNQGIPVSLRTVINHLDTLPGLVDRSFPGYTQAGLIGWAVDALFSYRPTHVL
jgi:hypothetical protein